MVCVYKNFKDELLCCMSGKLNMKPKHKPELILCPRNVILTLKNPTVNTC